MHTGGDLDPAEVDCGFLNPSATLPLTITPRDPALRVEPDRVMDWFGRHTAELDSLFTHHGAVLLRGFAIAHTATFRRLIDHFPPHAMGYIAGAAPRRSIGEGVYESTRMPPAARIGLHQEMAYMPGAPRLLAFYCHRPPDRGGETPLADMRSVTRRLTGASLHLFERRGVMYRRNFAADRTSADPVDTGPGLYHRSVRDAFLTDSRDRVESLCAERGLDWEWLQDGSLTVTHIGPATVRHPRTGERLWFNQASTQHVNARSVGSATLKTLRREYGQRPAWPYDIRFGDGQPMTESDLIPVYDALAAEEVRFEWRRGDVLWIDNLRVAHGRNPYRGPRDIQVALLD